MRVGIDLNNKQEADAVQRSLDDPLMKAAVVINGLLQALPTSTARSRVLTIVQTLNEPQLQSLPSMPTQTALRLRDGTSGD